MTNAPIPMPAETVLWVKALLSGNYAQTRGRLCEISPAGESYCCLGVAAKVLNAFIGQREATRWDAKNEENIPIVEAYVVDLEHPKDINSEVLNADLWNRLRGDAQGLGEQSDLAGFNDGGVPFAKIVDEWILPAFNLNRATFEEIYGPVPSQS